jgi:hypothetical protein
MKIFKILLFFILIFIYYWFTAHATNPFFFFLDLIGLLFLSIIWFEFLEAIEETREFNKENNQSWLIRKRNWVYQVYLPQELSSFLLSFMYAFFLFNWRASSIFILGITTFLFKRIIQDPLYIIHALLAYIFIKEDKERGDKLDKALFKANPNAIYISHLGYSKREIDEAIAIGLRSYLNNYKEDSFFIYHCDHREPELTYWTIKRINMLAKSLNLKNIIIFSRNQELPEKRFLGKPGAYLADYQFILTGIKHPLIYISKGWDARLQFIFKLDNLNNIVEEENHYPFIPPDNIENEENYFIYYKDKKKIFYLKETPYLKLNSEVEYKIKIECKSWLINKQNPKIKYRIFMGAIYDEKNHLLLSPNEWKLENNGKLKANKEIEHGYYFYSWDKKVIINGTEYFVDKDGNIRNIQTAKIFIKDDKYKLYYRYQLFEKKDNRLILLNEKFEPIKSNFIGEDFRRNPLQKMHTFPQETIEMIAKEKLLEEEKFNPSGIFGDIDKLNIGKLGWEDEYFVKIDSIKKKDLLSFREIIDDGIILNSKDGFYYDNRGNLFFYALIWQDKKPIKVTKDAKLLSKYEIYIDPVDKALYEKRLIAKQGTWYRDESNKIKRRKLISPSDLILEIEDQEIFYINPETGIREKALLDTSILNEDGIFCKSSKDDFIIEEENLIEEDGMLWEKRLIAKQDEYQVNEKGEIIVEGKKFKLGIFTKYKDISLASQRIPMIINQTDADGEFLKETLKNTNSFLTKQNYLREDYGMVQPEISFSNSSESLFVRLLSWAHEASKFAERGFFKLYHEAVSYGKVSKILPLYMNNVGFKEVIPAIARTHDHWEGMHLTTYLLKANPRKKINTLIETSPTNLYSYLKRRMGWLGGDIILLELESRLGVIISIIRSIKCYLIKEFKISKYWLNFAHKKVEHLKKNKKLSTALGRQRVVTLRKTTFSTTYFLSWLFFSGFISLIFPGILTIKTPILGWFLFIIMMLSIIFIPKIVVPVFYGLKKSWQSLFEKIYLLISIIGSIIIGNYLLHGFQYYLLIVTIIGYGLILIKGIMLPTCFVIFGKRRKLKTRIFALFSLFIFIFLILNIYPFLEILANKKATYWIPYFFLKFMPYFFCYFLIAWFFLSFSRIGTTLVKSIKESIKELLISTSTLLMLLIYEPINITVRLWKLIIKPFQRMVWLPQSYFEILGKKINSPFKAYKKFYLPPLVSIIFIFIPVFLYILHYSILSIGWPIFILSWLFGPFWAYWSGIHRKSFHHSRTFFQFVKEFAKRYYPLEKGISGVKSWLDKNEIYLDNDEKIKFLIFIYTEEIYRNLTTQEKQVLEDMGIKLSMEKFRDLRICNWQSLPELERIGLILNLKKDLSREEKNWILFLRSLLFNLLRKGWAETEWEKLNLRDKKNILSKICDKFEVSEIKKEMLEEILFPS